MRRSETSPPLAPARFETAQVFRKPQYHRLSRDHMVDTKHSKPSDLEAVESV